MTNRLDYKKLIFDKGYRKLVLVLFLVFIFTLLILQVFFNIYIHLNNYLVGITAIIIFWYTKETFDLKVISQKELKEQRIQTYLALRPFIRLQWTDGDCIRIINEGHGIAIQLKLSFSNTGFIRRSILCGEEASKSYTDACFDDIENRNDINIRNFREVYLPKKNTYSIEVTYKDIAGNCYKQVFKTDAKLNDKYKLIEWDSPAEIKPFSDKKTTYKNL